MRHAHPLIGAIGAALACLLSTTTARGAVDAGSFSCDLGGYPGFIVGSSRPLAGIDNRHPRPEHYRGSVTKFGMDAGYLIGGEIVRDVVAPITASAPAREMLPGEDAGVTGGAAPRVDAGANVRVGGSRRWLTSHPVGVED